MGIKSAVFSPRRVLEEIEYLITNYGSKGIYFVGGDFTINEKWTKTLCSLIRKHKLDIEWVCGTRVDLVLRDL